MVMGVKTLVRNLTTYDTVTVTRLTCVITNKSFTTYKLQVTGFLERV